MLLGGEQATHQVDRSVELAHRDQSVGAAVGGAGAPRASDAVGMVLDLLGHVIVDDCLDRRYVEAARGHVGGDEDGSGAALEFEQNVLPLGLCAVAVDGLDTVRRVCRERFGQLVGGQLGRHEDKHRALLQKVRQPADEPSPLERFGGEHLHDLCNVFIGVARLAHRHAHRLRQHVPSESLEVGLEGGREEEGLPVWPHLPDDRAHLREAEVEG
eukprot:scaffold22424_cov54-Phaeocystis_antarctica.AAC.1